MNPGRAGSSARLAAATTLKHVLDSGAHGEADDFSWPELAPRDRAFATHLVYGVLRWYSALRWLAGQLLQRPLKRRDRDLEMLILAGLLQLWQDDAPTHAAVHATVEAAKEAGKPWAAGLVNAVLRGFLRQRDSLLKRLDAAPERFAHPPWLLTMLQADWPEHWRELVEANNRHAPLWLRINLRRTDRAAYEAQLRAAGFEAVGCAEVDAAIRVEPAVGVSELPGFDDGLVSVQDAAAQLAAGIVDARPGQRVLDACAAPGGKTCHLLESVPDIRLTALDRDGRRNRLLRDNLQRLGLACTVLEADAAVPGEWWDGTPFDRILLDAPCSATGVIRRHPEIKWLRDAEQVENARQRQRGLLEALWPLLNPGGILVYATCSVLKCENSQQIEGMLSRHTDAAPEPGPGWPGSDPSGRQILPGEQDMDGFFYARLRKRG